MRVALVHGGGLTESAIGVIKHGPSFSVTRCRRGLQKIGMLMRINRLTVKLNRCAGSLGTLLHYHREDASAGQAAAEGPAA